MHETVKSRNLPPITSLPIRMTDGSTSSVHELRERFFASKYGAHMSTQTLRYAGRYNYDRELMKQDLGEDVCPVGHQYELTEHLQIILDDEQAANSVFNISDEEKAIVAFTSSIHDIGECEHADLTHAGLTVVGDIPAGGKTAADRANEAAVRQFFYQKFFNDVDPTVIARVEAIIAHQDDTILHDIFEAAHELQTLDTVAHAEKALERNYFIPEQLFALASLAKNVPVFHKSQLDNLQHFVALRKALTNYT